MIEISHIVSVYNKAPYLPFVVKALAGQLGGLVCEHIFVDDCSTDNSVGVLKSLAKTFPNIVIIPNSENRGPSMRVNQGAAAARGRFLQFVDSDDILAANATALLYQLMSMAKADFIFGRARVTNQSAASLVGTLANPSDPVFASSSPLHYVLKTGGFVRMACMVEKELFEKAGGCDEGVFIQDESLPLRLAAKSRRFVDFRGEVVLVPAFPERASDSTAQKKVAHISDSDAQLNHDRFLAHLRFWESLENPPSEISRMLYRHCVSAGWKQARKSLPAPKKALVLAGYLRSRLPGAAADRKTLVRLADMFAALPRVRRI
ncbi:MAG: glycosyltransferase family 2 protein [Desulfatibacillaceae bacterium]|nr:glycosyltransferase family 2 protein [Desulfatibacillaceae bacterium]